MNRFGVESERFVAHHVDSNISPAAANQMPPAEPIQQPEECVIELPPGMSRDEFKKLFPGIIDKIQEESVY